MKKKIALIGGGYSGEYIISLASIETIDNNLDHELYETYKIIISKDGWWYAGKDGHQIAVDKNDFSLMIDGERITFDAAFLGIHGTPGEDGKLQGYLDMMDIPYSTCNSIVSALTFNKYFCNKVVKDLGVVKIANSVVIFKEFSYSLRSILEELSLPVFVKPNESGSSLGISKVTLPEQILSAVERAFEEDSQVLIEEFIKGRELTIGLYKINSTIYCLPPTEIISKNEFFDFEAKYTVGVTDEITPAVIPESVLLDIQQKSKAIYRGLNCNG